ncbi:MAG: hypothetical protein JSU87_09625 [Gemmatimonadota bacterium]|nr:MAG: hypothetical protein JSU87_09625 [Gemmatimonadota bacterium]
MPPLHRVQHLTHLAFGSHDASDDIDRRAQLRLGRLSLYPALEAELGGAAPESARAFSAGRLQRQGGFGDQGGIDSRLDGDLLDFAQREAGARLGSRLQLGRQLEDERRLALAVASFRADYFPSM